MPTQHLGEVRVKARSLSSCVQVRERIVSHIAFEDRPNIFRKGGAIQKLTKVVVAWQKKYFGASLGTSALSRPAPEEVRT